MHSGGWNLARVLRSTVVGLTMTVGSIVGFPAVALAQDGTITGVVVARAEGTAVAEAVVLVDGTSLAAVANAVGRFRIDGVPPGGVTLVVQASGFLELRVGGVQVQPGGNAPLRVELEVTPNYLERVQVTASRAPLSVGDVAAQADIIDRTTIEQRGDQELVQAIAHVPGVIVSTQAGSFQSVTMRGLPRDGNEFTSTLLLIDGVPQTDSRNSARVVNLPINDASSIEVLRGPNSSLYGRTAIGGSINVRTAEPTPDHQFGFDFTTGGFDANGSGLDTAKGVARASGPIRDWGGYYVSASSEQNSSFYTGPFDFDVDRTAMFAKVTFVPDERSHGSVSVNRVLSAQSTPTNVPIIDGRLLSDIDARFDRLTNLNVPGPNYRQNEGRITANYTRVLSSWASIHGIFGYRAIQYKFIDDGDVIGGPFDLEATTLTMYPFEMQTDEDITYSEARIEVTPVLGEMRNTLTVGASYEKTGGFAAGNLMYTDPNTFGWPVNYLNPIHPPKSEWEFFRFGGNDYNLGSTGVFAQYLIEPVSRLMFTAAGRFDRFNIDNTLTFAPTPTVIEDSFDAFSPKLSAMVKLLGVDGVGPTVNAYATYSQAFLPPRRASQLRPGNELNPLNPEDIENYEVGMKGSAANGRVTFEGTFFYMTRDGIIASVRQGPFFLPTNSGAHEYKGFETGVGVTPLEDNGCYGSLSVYINASFYENRFGDFVIESTGGDTVLTGNRLPIAPDRVINAGLTWAPTDAVDVVVNAKHVGDVMVDQGNTFEFDPYTLVDLAVSWRTGPLRLTLSAHNVFDEEYFWNGDISRGESADVGPSRQVLLTTSFSFR